MITDAERLERLATSTVRGTCLRVIRFAEEGRFDEAKVLLKRAQDRVSESITTEEHLEFSRHWTEAAEGAILMHERAAQ